MALSIKEIEEISFKINAFRGYNIAEVDDFLDRVSGEIKRLQDENEALKTRAAECEEKEKHVSELEQTLRDTLITAQRAAEDVLKASREKAAAMIKDSELEGKRIVDDAELRAANAVQRLDGIRRDVAGVKALIRRVVGEQLRLLEESYPDEDLHESPAQTGAAAMQPLPSDFDRTQEFSSREVREAQEDSEAAKLKANLENLPQTGQDGNDQP